MAFGYEGRASLVRFAKGLLAYLMRQAPTDNIVGDHYEYMKASAVWPFDFSG